MKYSALFPSARPAQNTFGTETRLHDRASKTTKPAQRIIAAAVLLLLLGIAGAQAQTNVVTQHNDIGRTGQNRNETILAPSNVNSSSFGKLFSYAIDGRAYAQPLYVAGVTMGAGTPQAGTKHNVVFIATEHDSVYAFDADNNGGANSAPLWKITLLDSSHGAASGATTVPSGDVSTDDITPEIGITATPVIDTTTNTMYVVGKTKENGNYVQRLHALDITTGSEKSGSPVVLAAQVPGNGNGSSGGVLKFDPKWENNRPGLLLLNGNIYMGFAAHGDNGPWHGWILAYNAGSLQQSGVFCATSNGSGSGVWMSGAALAADTVNSGRLFVATGNGAFTANTPPYTNSMGYGDDLVRLDVNNGAMNVGDHFTPLNQANLNGQDADLGSGGVVVLPDQTSGGHTRLMVQAGKEGRIYLVDRDNLGGYSSSSDNIVQEIPVNPATNFSIGGLWSTPAYWNGNLYFWGNGDNLTDFSFASGKLVGIVASSSENSGFPGATPSVSSNGNSNGIVWDVLTSAYGSSGPAVLLAHNATNVASTLYSSNQNLSRDNPGQATKFVVPTVVNGKVYVGTANFLSVYGLLAPTQQAAAPLLNPGGQSFSGTLSVTITDSTPGSAIYYTTDGSTPTSSSAKYGGPITVSASETINAIANASGYVQSTVSSETYNLQTQVAAPSFSPAAGSFTSPQQVTLTSATGGAKIYYTTDGSTPTASSSLYTGAISVTTTKTIKALAVVSGYTNSNVTTAAYTVNTSSGSGGGGISLAGGFTAGTMALNGSATLNGTRLRLTDGGGTEAASAWYNSTQSIQTFSSSFSLQITPASASIADGMTFAIQGNSTAALGPAGGGLGYGPDNAGTALSSTNPLHNSVALKFDLYDNNGEGVNSTGLYVNGASPTAPSVDLTGSGVDLHSGHVLNVQVSYDGTNLTLTITDPTVNSTFTQTWPINIPATIGGNSAYVGFTGGTGGLTAVQDVLNWTFSSTATTGATATPVIIPGTGTFTSAQSVIITDATAGATMYYTLDGSQPTTASTKYTGAFTASVSTTVKAIAVANGSTSSTATSNITIQAAGSTGINFSSGFTAAGLQLNGNAVINGNRLQLTDTSTNFQDSSAFWTQKVNIQNFTNDFNFQITNPLADGLTFTIQGVSPTALGGAGGQLGYGPTASGTPGIANSVAVKFDIYNNGGEGTNSTGLYINGADPIGASTTLGGGVNLQSGDIFAVHMTYNGATLTMTITDTANPSQTFTTSWPVNITSAVGTTSAYVGFTGATGGSVATQQIVTWSFASGKSPLVFQTTALPTSSSGPGVRLLNYPGFPDGTGTILDATSVGDNITFTVAVPAAGIYDVKVSYKQYITRGIMQAAVNSTTLGAPVDEFIATGDAYAVSDLGNLNFANAGNYLFKFTVVGKNAGSSGYTTSFDAITLTPQ